MKKVIYLASVIVLALGFVLHSCGDTTQPQWESLFNGQDLANWDMFLGSSLGEDFDDLAQAATPEQVFSVVEMEGEKVIRISGEINGSLATKESYENYHLQLVFKWGDIVYSRRNSGLLYHSFGDFGVAFGTWMPNIELQLMHTNLGDTYLMANTSCQTPVVQNEETNQFVFTPGANNVTFGEHAAGRLIRKSHDMEKPLGQWNIVDLYVYDDMAVHVINGETVMVNYNTGVYENGVVLPLTAGKIQIQSEGAELFVKSIDIKAINEIPAELIP